MKRLYNMRWTLARRALQLAVLGLFAGTARLGWTLAGEPLLDGTLSASEVAGTIPLSDPLALLERLAAGHMPTLTAGLGALNFSAPGIYKVRVVTRDAGNRKTECDIRIPVSR